MGRNLRSAKAAGTRFERLIADHLDHPRSECIAHLASYPFLDGDSLANGGGCLPQVKTPIDTGKISGLLSEASASELR